MKRKVRAQRKYAQGAYIPPSAPPVTPLLALLERRAESLASNAKEFNVVINKMSAKDILDMVSFRNVHKLMQPVVRLNRMEQEERERKEEEERKRKNPAEAAEEPGAVMARPAGAASQGRVNMQLRSRLHHSFKPCKTAVNQKKKKPQLRLLNDGMPTKSVMRKRKRQSVADSDDLEDDKPLKYFARAVIARDAIRKRNEAKPTVRAATRVEPAHRAAHDVPRAQTRARTDASRANPRDTTRAATDASRAKQRTKPRTAPVVPRDTINAKTRDPTDAPRAERRTKTRTTRRAVSRLSARDTTRAVAGESSFQTPLFPSRRTTAHLPDALVDADLCATERELASRAYDVYDFNNSDEESITLRYGSPDSVGRCQLKRKASDHNDLDLISEFDTHEFLETSSIHASNRRSATSARHDALQPDIMVSVFEGRIPSAVHTQIVTADIHKPPIYAQSPARDLQPPAGETRTHAVESQPLLRDLQTPSLDYQSDTQKLGAETQSPALELQSLTLDNQSSGPETQLPTRERCPTPKPANAEPRYLDIIPFGNHIIQITNEPVGKGEKNIMRARVVPKPQSVDPNEAQFIEHEDLLEQLLRVKKEVEIPKPVERKPVRVIGNVIVIPDDGVEELPADVKPSISSGATDVKLCTISSAAGVPSISSGATGVAIIGSGAAGVVNTSSGVAGAASISSGAAAVASTSRGPSPAAVASTNRGPPLATVASTSRGPSPAAVASTSRGPSPAAVASTSRGPSPAAVASTSRGPSPAAVASTSRGPSPAAVASTSRGPSPAAVASTNRGPPPAAVASTSRGPSPAAVASTNRGPQLAAVASTSRGLPPAAVASTSRGPSPAAVASTSRGPPPATMASTSRGPPPAAVSNTSRGLSPAAVASTNRGPPPAAVASTSRGPPAPSRPTTRKQSGAAPPREMVHAGGDSVEAPVFYPTEAEFNDPLAYFEKIAITASKYGLCKVVAPPGFNPTCALSDDVRFTVSNQYIARLYSRWGPASREMCAIKTYLASQSVIFSRAPLNEGIEVNLPKLYHIVQRNGGLKKVIEKKRWGRVAEEMHFTRGANPEKRVDQFYVKYLLPYDTLSNQERHNMMNAVERCWNKKNQKMLERAMNPLHRQKRLLGESDSSSDEDEIAGNLASALSEAEDCVVSGRIMNLNTFRKVAANAMATMFPSTKQPTPDEVENEYWRLVLLGTEHVCVNTASIDTGDEGYGFTKNKADPYGRHPWNLKMVSQNSGNVLRSLGPVLGVTVPTLHLGMVCSTSCWHRDPHGLPWVEYMHAGPPKIWYGIPGEQSENFRKAVEALCPTSCQNKSIWLPSDITMIPPNLLREHNVSLSRVVQRPGEFILVFPKAYSCSISTGFTQSESVYFATKSWLMTVTQVFQEVRESCEPTMFSLEQLLLAVGRDARAPLSVLVAVLGSLRTAVLEEAAARRALARAGVTTGALAQAARTRHKRRPAGAWNVREQDECEICRTTLFFSKVTGLTDKNRSVCLQHALRLVAAGRAANTGTLVTYYLQAELEDAIEAAERRLNVQMRVEMSRLHWLEY